MIISLLTYILDYNFIYKLLFSFQKMSKKSIQHKRFGHKTHEHVNFYKEFSKATERAKEMNALSGRLRRQAEEAERKRQESLRSSNSFGGFRWYFSLSTYLLEDNFPYLPYERYQARSIFDIV